MGLDNRDYARKRPLKLTSRTGGWQARIRSAIPWPSDWGLLSDAPMATIILFTLSLLVSGAWYLLGKNFFLPPPDNITEAEAMMDWSIRFLRGRDWLATHFVMPPHFWYVDRPYTCVTHVFLHGGIMNGLFAVLGALMFGIRVEHERWGPWRTGLLMLLATAGGVLAFILSGQQSPAYGCWAISAAMACVVMVQDPYSLIGGWRIRVAAVAYVIAALAGLPMMLSGDPTQYALILGGGGLGLVLGTVGRVAKWE